MGLQASEATLLRRLAQHPGGQIVAIACDTEHVVGAIYTQRLSTEAPLLDCTVDDELQLHDPVGRVVQLLGLVAEPHVRTGLSGVGDALRDFMLRQAQLDASVLELGAKRQFYRKYLPGSSFAICKFP